MDFLYDYKKKSLLNVIYQTTCEIIIERWIFKT